MPDRVHQDRRDPSFCANTPKEGPWEPMQIGSCFLNLGTLPTPMACVYGLCDGCSLCYRLILLLRGSELVSPKSNKCCCWCLCLCSMHMWQQYVDVDSWRLGCQSRVHPFRKWNHPPHQGGLLGARFFLLRTALKDRPKGPPTANHCQLPPTTNHQPPTAANHHQPPVASRQPSLATNCQPPIATNHG